LKKLKRDAEAYFSEPNHPRRHHRSRLLQRRATQRHKKAGELAGLTVERIVNEPPPPRSPMA